MTRCYAWPLTVLAGEDLKLHVSTAHRRFGVRLFRYGAAVTEVPGQSQIYVRDTCFGTVNCLPKTVLISVGQLGNAVGGAAPSLSGDGHFAAFVQALGPNGGQVLLARTGF